jgi:shikimate dehydrogenase
MHNFIYQKLGIEIVYKKWEIEEQNLKLHIGKINNDDFVGANVTVPYKEKIVPFLDEIKDEAKFTGAVNTIVKNDNKLTGYNTDVYGIEKTLDIKLKNDVIKNAVIFGAGGAAKAALYVLFQKGLKNLIIINRTKANAVKMVDQFNDFNFDHSVLTFNEIPQIKTACLGTDLIINTTILGMKGSGYEDISPIDSTFIDSNSVIFDMVYNPTKTQLIKIALDKNANIIEGLNMLVYQAIKSIELWTGISPSFDDMYNKCKEILEGKLNNE